MIRTDQVAAGLLQEPDGAVAGHSDVTVIERVPSLEATHSETIPPFA